MNRKLLRSVREYKRESFLTPVLVCLEVLMEVLIPLLMANIIDVGLANGDMGYIIRTGVLLAVMDEDDDGYYKRTDGVYVYDPSPCQGADHDYPVVDHDVDDQCKDRGHYADYSADSRRSADRYREDGSSSFRSGV